MEKAQQCAQTKKAFQDALGGLSECFDKPLALTVEHVTVGSASDVDGKQTVVVELRAQSTSKSGIEFDNYYAWVCETEERKIVCCRAYLDSALVRDVMDKDASP